MQMAHCCTSAVLYEWDFFRILVSLSLQPSAQNLLRTSCIPRCIVFYCAFIQHGTVHRAWQKSYSTDTAARSAFLSALNGQQKFHLPDTAAMFNKSASQGTERALGIEVFTRYGKGCHYYFLLDRPMMVMREHDKHTSHHVPSPASSFEPGLRPEDNTHRACTTLPVGSW